ncbi:MAG: Pantothenate synthetase [Turneriella sp.]|nr:Pantothenate synthetase [Turneriella sp.]
MIQLDTVKAMRAFSRDKASLGFVPTMGFLHEGHLSLVRRAKAENEYTVVSIFVNPAQFNDANDLEKYPTDLERDLVLLEREGVDAVFIPKRDEVYPEGTPTVKIRYDALMGRLCGAFRENHFEGMLLIVHNLFMWVSPTRAYFGLKDYQQFLLVEKMARDLAFPVTVHGCPLVREEDGLALSSRNVRLSTKGRSDALVISRSLFEAKADVERGGVNFALIKKNLHAALNSLRIEYASLYDAQTLEELTLPGKNGVLIAVAAYVEGVRLIDNVLIEPC